MVWIKKCLKMNYRKKKIFHFNQSRPRAREPMPRGRLQPGYAGGGRKEAQVYLIPITATPWKTIQTAIPGGCEWHCPECGWRKRWTKDGSLVTIAEGNPAHAHRGMPLINGRSGGGGISKRARKQQQPRPELRIGEQI